MSQPIRHRDTWRKASNVPRGDAPRGNGQPGANGQPGSQRPACIQAGARGSQPAGQPRYRPRRADEHRRGAGDRPDAANGRSQQAGYRAHIAHQALTGRRRDEHRAPAGRGRSSVRLTGRGAVLLMLAVFALGLLAASWLGEAMVSGVAFLVGSVAAARFSRPAALLTVSVTPPLLFFCVLVTVKAMTASGNLALSTAEGSALALAQAAPWLLTGAAASLAIAWFRGLPLCLSGLRQDLREGRPGQRAR